MDNLKRAAASHPDAAASPEGASTIEAAELIVTYLERLGVEAVFGVPGGAIEPMYNALARSERRGGPRAVVARHEAGAAFMADGYARETGRIGVCVATSGPGATNLITGVATAYANNVPMLVITGQPPLRNFGRGALQESSCTGINAVGMMRHCTRYNSLVSHADQLETKLIAALMRAFQTPQGPVHLSIPVDLLRSAVAAPSQEADRSALVYARPALVDLEAMAALRGEIERAERPVFLVGAGCAEAIEAIMRLVDLTGALFITTPDAKGLVNPRHHAWRGVFGFGGHASADALLREQPDLVVAFGTAFSELASAGWHPGLLNSRLVHVDPSDEHLMRSPMARLHVRGHILSVCRALIDSLAANDAHNVVSLPAPAGDAASPHVTLHAPEQVDADSTPVKPQRLMRELSRRCPPNTRFLADTGNSMIWAVHYLQPRNRRGTRTASPALPDGRPERRSGTASWLRVMMDFAPMGWAIGAAVGIARGNPSCPVVCITGDGSYLMSGQEISVAAAEGLTVVYVVLNDSAYGMVMHGQRLAKAEPIGFELPQVDFAAMARAMGVPGHVAESPADLEALDFEAIFARQGPTLIDVRIDRDEVPPMIQRLKALGAVK